MEFLKDIYHIVLDYWPQLLRGVGNTMLIALTGTVAGLLIGLLIGVLRTTPSSKNPVLRVLHKILNAICTVYVEVFRGTPMVLQAVFIYYGLPYFTHSAVAFSGYAGICNRR